jgi:hypothetical protein
MTLSTLESPTRCSPHSVCPHCGRHVDPAPPLSMIETVLGVLAGLALALILIPLAITAWKSCIEFLSNDVSHSIFSHPLEDWTPY